MTKIQINYDFTTGLELPYGTILSYLDSSDVCVQTHCLQFFNNFNLNVTIMKYNGDHINNQELLENTGEYTDKQICREHNILKIFLVNGFKWSSKMRLNADENWIC